MHRTGRGITPRPVRGHKIALLVMLFCCLICVSARVERGALPDMLLKKMGNVIVCYADWSECDEKVFYLPLPPSLFLSLSPSLSPFLHPPVSLSCSHLSLSARTLSLLQKMLAVNKWILRFSLPVCVCLPLTNEYAYTHTNKHSHAGVDRSAPGLQRHSVVRHKYTTQSEFRHSYGEHHYSS
jgi:hypothetical protein